MSLSSYYHMDTSFTPNDVFELLRDNLTFVTGEQKFEKFRPTLYTTNNGLQIETYPDKEAPDCIEDAFGFLPKVRVALHLARGNDPGFEEGALNRVRVVDWLINHVEGDAVFLVNGDLPVLLRKDGKVWLHHKDRFWSERNLPLLSFPYEWKELNY